MPNTIQKVIELVTPQIEALLNEHKEALGPGREFVVTVGTREVKTVSVGLAELFSTDLTKADWDCILSWRWVGKFRVVLEEIRDNGNQPTSVDRLKEKIPDFYVAERDNINRTLKHAGMPFFVRNTVHGSQGAHLQVIRK